MSPTTHPVRFGLQTPPEGGTWSELVNVWKFADDLGYDTLWTSDHFVPGVDPTGPVDIPVLDGWTTLGALGVLTRRARCGVMITGNPYRHPPQLAKIAATIDTMTNGRLIMGIGSAWHKPEHEMYGVPWHPPAERVHRMGEAVQIFKRLWRDERATFEGKYYRVKDAVCEPKPVQQPSIPIWIGGGGEQLTLKYVAREADGWNLIGSPVSLPAKLEALKRHCDAAGRDMDEIEKSVMHMRLIMTDDADDARAYVERQAVQRNKTFDDMWGHFMIGTPEQMRDTIGKLIDLGFTHFVAQVMQPYDYEAIERWHKEVAMQFKERS